jgi:Na+-translocating ferredoxin:NAD+ oxidoreductase RNF subunit RnfB
VPQKNAFKWLPVVIEEFCTGCGLCVEACGPDCLETRNGVAVLERPGDCGSEEHCISACPEDAIHMAWLPSQGGKDVGLWRASAVKEESAHA